MIKSYRYHSVHSNKETIVRDWILIDAENQVLGRMSTRIAMILRGKHKPSFSPHAECGDHVVVVNAEKVKLTGNKLNDKIYVRHSGYPGGQRFRTPAELLVKKPFALVEEAVRGMLPKNKLGRALFKNLHVFVGPEHKHQAQQPKTIDINTIR